MSLRNSLTDLIGFTEEELKENYMEVLKAYCEEDYIETELKNLKYQYNGYKFNVSETENRVFSPFSIISHFMTSLDNLSDLKQKKNEKNQSIFFR